VGRSSELIDKKIGSGFSGLFSASSILFSTQKSKTQPNPTQRERETMPTKRNEKKNEKREKTEKVVCVMK
jgi:hypothetical protein